MSRVTTFGALFVGWGVLAGSTAIASHGNAQVGEQPGLTLLSPTTERPTQDVPGATLSIHVRLVTALTPPPGVQQPRALREWSAVLVGMDQDEHEPTVQHAYRLAVTNVRPVTGHSLDYRVQVPLPAWIAPGRYTVRLSGPGGTTQQPDSVHVRVGELAPGAKRVVLRSGLQLVPVGATAASGILGLRWYPATTLGLPTQVPAVLAWLPADGVTAPVTTQPAPSFSVSITVQPPPRAGQVTTLLASGAPQSATFAWSLSDGTTAYGPQRLRHVFQGSGTFSGVVMAIDPNGNARTTRFELDVQPGLRFGCQSCPLDRPSSAFAAFAPLILALALLKRRPRRGVGIN